MIKEITYENQPPAGFPSSPQAEIVGEGDESTGSITESPKRSYKKRKDTSQLRKAPQAPKRFKSSYICFFMAKQPEIKEELGDKATVTEISKRSAEMWYVFTQHGFTSSPSPPFFVS